MTDDELGFPDYGVFLRTHFFGRNGRDGHADLWFRLGDAPKAGIETVRLGYMLHKAGKITWDGPKGGEWFSTVARFESVPPRLRRKAVRCFRDRRNRSYSFYTPTPTAARTRPVGKGATTKQR